MTSLERSRVPAPGEVKRVRLSHFGGDSKGAGDAVALRLCLDRIIPARRGRPVQLGMTPVRGTADLGDAMAAITNAATGGVITPGEAAELARVVEIFVRAVEASDFERRLKALEEQFAEDADLTRMTWPAGT